MANKVTAELLQSWGWTDCWPGPGYGNQYGTFYSPPSVHGGPLFHLRLDLSGGCDGLAVCEGVGHGAVIGEVNIHNPTDAEDFAALCRALGIPAG